MDVILSVAAGFLVLVVLAWPVRNRKAERQARLDRLESALVNRILLELHATAETKRTEESTEQPDDDQA
jgi:hypothetical protein